MGFSGGFSPESSSEQNFRYSPQSATGQGVNLMVGQNGTAGNRNAGNIDLRGKATLVINQQLGADAVGALSAGITKTVNDALAANAAAAASNDYTKASIGTRILDRAGDQVTDAPEDEKKSTFNISLAIGALLFIGLIAAMLGRKRNA